MTFVLIGCHGVKAIMDGSGATSMTVPTSSAPAVTESWTDAYIAVRRWQDDHMPLYGSLIGFDLILFLSRSRFQSSPYSLKDVFHSLRYSEGALRIFIRRLEKDGWIRLETWPGDRRNKKIIVEDKLFLVIDAYFHRLHELIGLPADPAE